MLFLQIFATFLTFWVSGLQAQFPNVDLLKNAKDYGIATKNYENKLQLTNPTPNLQGYKPEPIVGGKNLICQRIRTQWNRIGCQGNITPQISHDSFRDAVVALGNDMTLRYLQKYSNQRLPAEKIAIRSRQYKDQVPRIVSYIEKYLPKIYTDKKLLQHVLYEIDEYLFKPLIRYVRQFDRTVEQDSEFEDYLRGKDVANIIKQYVKEPIDNVVPVSGNSYQQNRDTIIKYITSHVSSISKNLLNIILCKIQEQAFKETPKSTDIQSPSNDRLSQIYNVQDAQYSKEYQPGSHNVIPNYYPQYAQMVSDKPLIVPKEDEEELQTDRQPISYRPEAEKPEKSTISSLEEDRPEKSTGILPSKEDKPEKASRPDSDEPEQFVRPGSTPSKENKPQESSTDETDPEKELLLKFLKKYYPEHFDEHISTKYDTVISTSQDSQTDSLTKNYLNKKALLKFLQKFYPELLRKKQFMDEISKNYPDEYTPNYGYSEVPIPTYAPVSPATISPNIDSKPSSASPASERAPTPTASTIATVTPNILESKPPTSPTDSPISLVPTVPPKVTQLLKDYKPVPIPKPNPIHIDFKPTAYPVPTIVTAGISSIYQLPQSPLYPRIQGMISRQQIVERIKKLFPHVYTSGKFLKALLEHLETKNMQSGGESAYIDYIRQHYPTIIREGKPNTVWQYEYPEGVYNKPEKQELNVQEDIKPTPVSGAHQTVPSKEGENIKDNEDIGDQLPSDEKPGVKEVIDDEVPDKNDEPMKDVLVGHQQIYGQPEDKPETIRLPGKYYANHNFIVHHKNIFKVSRPIYPNLYSNQIISMPNNVNKYTNQMIPTNLNKDGTPANLIAHSYQHPVMDMSKVYNPNSMPQHLSFQNIPFSSQGKMIKVKYTSGGHMYSTNDGNHFMKTLYENNIPSPGIPTYTPFATQFNYPQVGNSGIKPVDTQSAVIQDGKKEGYNVQMQMNKQLRAELVSLLYQNHLSPLMLRSYGQLCEKLQNGASLSESERKEMHELEDMFASHAAFLQLYQQKFAQTLHGIKSLLYNMYKRLFGQETNEINTKYSTGYAENDANKFMTGSEQRLIPGTETAVDKEDSNDSNLNPPEPVQENNEPGLVDNMRKSAFDNINFERLGSLVKKPFSF